MPHHDVYCERCGEVQVNLYLPLYTLPEPRVADGYVVTQDFDRPLCCGQPVSLIPPRVAIDAYSPFQAFTTEVLQPDGSHATVTVDSLSKLRAIERETETRQRNGEGQHMIWRDYAQDRSNRDVHTMGPMDGGAKLDPAAKARFGRKHIKVSTAAPDVTYGPGVSDANTSALGGA